MLSHAEICVLCNTVYDNPNVIEGNSKALVFEQDGFQYIVFAGTDNFLDVLEDAKAVPEFMQGLGHVHGGMMDYYFTIREKALALAVESKLPKIIGGHSLGGAVALFCGWDFQRIMPVVEVVTFGCPRGFCSDSGAVYRAAGIKTTNYIHGRDLVPELPSFMHRPGDDIFFTGTGERLSHREPMEFLFSEVKDRLGDHLLEGPEGYIECLRRLTSPPV